MRRLWILSLCVVACVFCRGGAWAGEVAPVQLLRLLDTADRSYTKVFDYTSVMLSRERVKDVLLPPDVQGIHAMDRRAQ